MAVIYNQVARALYIEWMVDARMVDECVHG